MYREVDGKLRGLRGGTEQLRSRIKIMVKLVRVMKLLVVPKR